MSTKSPFWIVNETRLGHFSTNPGFNFEQPLAPIEKSRDLKLCNGFRIWHWPPTEELMDRIVRETDFLQVDFWIGTSLHEHWLKVSGKTEEAFYDFYVTMLKAAAEKYGDKFFWTITGEPDTQAPNWPTERFDSRKAACAWFLDWIKSIAPAMDPKTQLRWHDYLVAKKVDLKKHHVAIHVGYPTSAHYSYELGVRLVWVECNAYLVEGVQLSVAFARGAANQFRANQTYWGLDFSTFNDPSGFATSYDDHGRRMGGCTESLLLREWIVAFMSGVNLLHQEVSDRTHWIWNPKPYARLSKTGRLASRFGKFALAFDRGEPYRSVAVMLEHDHGWMSAKDDAGGNQVWFGTIPAGKADVSISHFFDLAFPGHADGLKGYGELYSRNPWKTMDGLRAIVKSGQDLRRYETGRLVPSHWGDVIDVILEDCPEDVLADYPVLVILGGLKIKDHLAAKLERYVRAGGRVIANVTNFFDCPEALLENHVSHGTQGHPWSIPSTREGLVSSEIETFLGFKFTRMKLGCSSAMCLTCGQAMVEEGFLAEGVELQGAVPIATVPRYLYMTNPDPPIEQTPLAVEHQVGKGKVIVTLAYFMMQPVFRQPLKITAHIYDHLIQDTLPLKVQGPPLQYLFNRVEGGWLVSLFNNRPERWDGELICAAKPLATILEWGKGGELSWEAFEGGWRLKLHMAKFDFKIVRIRQSSECH